MEMSQYVDQFLNGYNISLLAYGQTGSGKTHTMFGDPKSLGKNSQTPEVWGLFPKAVIEILEKINSNGNTGVLTATVIEIFCFQLYDLVAGRKMLGNGKITNIDSALEMPIRNIEDLLKLINIMMNYRAMFGTKMN